MPVNPNGEGFKEGRESDVVPNLHRHKPWKPCYIQYW